MSITRRFRRNLKHLAVRAADLVTGTQDEPPTPMPLQLTDASLRLITIDRDLAADVSDVIQYSRGEIPDSLYWVFEDLLIVCDWHEEDPQDEHVADIRALLRLVKTVATPEPATH